VIVEVLERVPKTYRVKDGVWTDMSKPSIKKIYLVTHGEYSSYMILCAFEKKEHAEGYIAALVAADDQREADGGFRRYGDIKWDIPKIEELEVWDVLPVITSKPESWVERGEEELSR
jgi:hypothetical protein